MTPRFTRSSASALARAVLLAGVLLAVAAADGTAAQPLGEQQRVSQMGADGNALFRAGNPAAAYDSNLGQFLVVWHGDDAIDDKFEIWGRFVSASGAPIGLEFKIGTAAGDATRDAEEPRVAYNPTRREYVVVWVADNGALDNDLDIWGRRVGAAGELPGPIAQVSEMGPGDATLDGEFPHVAYNSQRDEYLVAWHGRNAGDPVLRIYGQRLAGATGTQIGADALIAAPGGGGTYPQVAYNSRDGEYLVTFIGGPLAAQRAVSKRLSADGSPQAGNAVQLSSDSVQTHKTAVAYNPHRNEYLVAWPSYTPPGTPEVRVQRVSAAGAEIGADDLQISSMGPDSAFEVGVDVGVSYSPVSRQYLVAWRGDDNMFGLVDNEWEVFGQTLNDDGQEIGQDDVPISSMGPDGTIQFGAGGRELLTGSLAHDPVNDRFIVPWYGDDGAPLADDEHEAFVRLVAPAPPPPAPPPPPPVAPPPPPRPPPPPPPKLAPLVPRFSPEFETRKARKRGPTLGQLLRIGALGELDHGSTVRIRCDRACRLDRSFTIRTRGSRKNRRIGLTFRPVRIVARTIIEVRATRPGYRGRYTKYKFKRGRFLVSKRISSGCLSAGRAPKRQPCGK